MKTKIFLTAILAAIIGVSSTLFVYSHINASTNQSLASRKNGPIERTAPVVLTSMQSNEGPVDLTYAAEHTVQAVVHVRVRSTVASDDQSDNPFFQFFNGNDSRQQPRKITGFGSGVIISPDGYIITNNHVIDGADSIQVTLYNNKSYPATVIGRDPDTDIALIKINAENLPVIKFGDSDILRLGEWVLAVGNPFNLTSTVTAGIVSAKGRSLDLDGSYKLESFIQTDAALNMGNSGGALVNTKGELVGITSAIVSPTGTYSGNSFAIPVNIVKKTVSDLKRYGRAQRAFMGINMRGVTSDLAQKEKLANVSGVYVVSTVPGGAAAEAGIKTEDVIVKIDDKNIGTAADLQENVAEHHPGDKIKITYFRNGKEETALVELKNVDGTTSVVLKNTGESVFGSEIIPLTSTEKEKYVIDSGTKVTSVGEGKLKDLGIKNGTIISAINGKKVNNVSEIREATSDGESLSSIEGIQPNGMYFSFQFKN
jgi:Do/DeqQ family serine protease